MKKPFIIVGLTGLVLIMIGTAMALLWAGKSLKVVDPHIVPADVAVDATETVNIEDGGADEVIYKEFENDLLKLFYDYRDAQILTQASLNLKFEETKLEDFQALVNQAISKWDEVEADVAIMDKYSAGGQSSRLWERFKLAIGGVPTVQAYGEGETSEVGLRVAGFEHVKYMKNALPSLDEEILIKSEFGGTAVEVKKKLIEYHEQESANWGNWVTVNDIASKTSTGISSVSKVALFIGGAILTGGAAGLAAPITGLSGTMMTISGVDLICTLGQDATTLGFADKQTGETFGVVQKKMAPLTFVANVADVKSYKDNLGGAISAVYGLGEMGYNFINMEVDPKYVKISGSKNRDARIPVLNSDGFIENYFPPEYTYEVNPYTLVKEEEKMLKAQEEAKSALTAYVGPYAGSISYTAPVVNMEIEIPIKVLVGYEDVKLTVDYAGNLPFKMQGMTFEMSVDVKNSANLTGRVDEDKKGFTASGNFSSSGHTNVPAEIAANMPPEYAGMLSDSQSGTASAKATFDEVTQSLKGVITYNTQRGAVSLPFSAKMMQVTGE